MTLTLNEPLRYEHISLTQLLPGGSCLQRLAVVRILEEYEIFYKLQQILSDKFKIIPKQSHLCWNEKQIIYCAVWCSKLSWDFQNSWSFVVVWDMGRVWFNWLSGVGQGEGLVQLVEWCGTGGGFGSTGWVVRDRGRVWFNWLSGTEQGEGLVQLVEWCGTGRGFDSTGWVVRDKERVWFNWLSDTTYSRRWRQQQLVYNWVSNTWSASGPRGHFVQPVKLFGNFQVIDIFSLFTGV